jgi:molybdopterin-synthase adenylyltransferase
MDVSHISEGRYAKQELFRAIGPAGQRKIAGSTATVIGMGALGTVIAGQLCRAGVGRLRLIDRDFVEVSNLQRQVLFDEDDARRRLPKAVAAAEKLRAVNSEITIEPLVADVTPQNVGALIAETNVVLDGTDNLETRFVINDAAVKTGVPWVYGGALGAVGMSMTIVPGKTACLRCYMDEPPAPGTMPSCDTEGVLAAVTGLIGSVECAEALKLLVGAEPRPTLLYVDVWQGEFFDVAIERRADCAACARGEFEYLAGSRVSWTTVLCGRNAVQIVPPSEREIPLQELEQRLARIGRAHFNGFLLSFEAEGRELVVFPTGRAIIRGTTDEAEARQLYARYVGV